MTLTAPALLVLLISSCGTPIAKSAYPSPLKSANDGAAYVCCIVPRLNKGSNVMIAAMTAVVFFLLYVTFVFVDIKGFTKNFSNKVRLHSVN